jgi:hypothetical protein
MRNSSLLTLLPVLFMVTMLVAGCERSSDPEPDPPVGGLKIDYGDSILYLRNQAGNTIVIPQPMGRAGRFYAFPDGMEIDETTGAINISKSETGFRYRVTFVADNNRDSVSTKIVLAGINYQDFYHVQAQNDSLSRPSYNANLGNFNLPAAIFDEDGSARARGLAINPVTGVINLNQTIRNGFFRPGLPQNNDQREVDVSYRLQDRSGNARNTIAVKLYFFNRMSDVDNGLKDLINDRKELYFKVADSFGGETLTGRTAGAAKPRPPCVVVLAQ